MTRVDPPELLQQWFDRQRAATPDDLDYKEASARQIMFVRDEVAGLFGCGLDSEAHRGLVEVVATHTSKSVLLPVYNMERRDLGLRLILRDNFYNYKLSVISEAPLDVDFTGLCHTTPPPDPDYTGDPLHPVYFEGFPEELIFGYYAPSDRRKFSLEIWGGQRKLWTVVFLIMRARGALRPFEWGTRKTP